MTTKANVYEMVTDRIIAELEKGIVPWKRPWTGVRTKAYNRITKKPYSIINQILLKYSGEYATFKQWSELGGHIKKGEKSEIVVFWKIYQKEGVAAPADSATVPTTFTATYNNTETLALHREFHNNRRLGHSSVEYSKRSRPD